MLVTEETLRRNPVRLGSAVLSVPDNHEVSVSLTVDIMRAAD
jgi:hypothetical protein